MNDERPASTDRAPARRSALDDRRSVGVTMATLGLGSLWTYLCFVFLPGKALVGVAVPAGIALTWFVLGQSLRRRPTLTRPAILVGLSCIMVAGVMLAADVAFGVFVNWSELREGGTMSPEKRRDDPQLWHGELYPEFYYPTDRNFTLFKPNVSITGDTYGEFYHPDLLRSPTVVDSVLERKTLTYRIGPLGLRDTSPVSDARLFALGDSFAMGYSTDEGLTWTDRLGEMLGEHVYNMGVSATGPNTQRMLLEHILDVHAETIQVDRVLWMLFEGNDLENSAQENRPSARTRGGVVEGTLLDNLTSIPAVVRKNSIVGGALAGTLRRPASMRTGAGARHLADGIPSHFPLYHSERWGYRLFNGQDVERAGKPLAYVTGHDNWPRMKSTFRKMQELSKQKEFKVTVVLAPSAARLYGPAFEDCPNPSDTPHLINALADLSRESGFEVIDLFAAMQPHAKDQMLYYRDDHHWNVRGNALAAEIIYAELNR